MTAIKPPIIIAPDFMMGFFFSRPTSCFAAVFSEVGSVWHAHDGLRLAPAENAILLKGRRVPSAFA